MRMSARKRSEQWYERQDEINKEIEQETAQKILKDKEFINSLSPEKQRQYKIMKVIFTIFMLSFYLAALIAYSFGWKVLVSTLMVELGFALISVVFWRDPPKTVPFPRVFAMPVLAFLLTVVAIGGFFLRDAVNGKFSSADNQTEVLPIAQEENTTDVLEVLQTELTELTELTEQSEYELWLRGNNVIEDKQGE